MAAADGCELYALSIRYGQTHAREIDAARRVARALRVARHLELDVPLSPKPTGSCSTRSRFSTVSVTRAKWRRPVTWHERWVSKSTRN